MEVRTMCEEDRATDLRKLLDRLPDDMEGGTTFEYGPHVGTRTQTIHLEPAGPDAEGDEWVAWTRFGGVEADNAIEIVRCAARESAGLSFRESDGDMRAQVLLEDETPVEVQARLVEHLGEVSDRIEFRLSEGSDNY